MSDSLWLGPRVAIFQKWQKFRLNGITNNLVLFEFTSLQIVRHVSEQS